METSENEVAGIVESPVSGNGNLTENSANFGKSTENRDNFILDESIHSNIIDDVCVGKSGGIKRG